MVKDVPNIPATAEDYIDLSVIPDPELRARFRRILEIKKSFWAVQLG